MSMRFNVQKIGFHDPEVLERLNHAWGQNRLSQPRGSRRLNHGVKIGSGDPEVLERLNHGVKIGSHNPEVLERSVPSVSVDCIWSKLTVKINNSSTWIAFERK
jgi:hypothetical protein